MQHLEGSGTPVLYIGRTVLKGCCETLKYQTRYNLQFWFDHTQSSSKFSFLSIRKYTINTEVLIHKTWPRHNPVHVFSSEHNAHACFTECRTMSAAEKRESGGFNVC